MSSHSNTANPNVFFFTRSRMIAADSALNIILSSIAIRVISRSGCSGGLTVSQRPFGPVSAFSQRAKKTLHHKTSRNEPERFFADLSLAFELLPLIFGRRHAGAAFKERGKTPQAVKPHRKARLRHRQFLLQQFLCPLDAHMRQVLMRRPPIDALERADKMKLRITRLIRDLPRIDPLGIIAVNEQLRLHDPAIKI